MDKVVTNKLGGKQSAVDGRFNLIPPLAEKAVAEVLQMGSEKYGVDNWRLIPHEDHINHALAHINAHRRGDTSERHLANAICRLMFAMEMDQVEESKELKG